MSENADGKKSNSEDYNNIDVWDDSLLIEAYDTSLQLGKEDIAKLISERTNSKKRESQKNAAHCSKVDPNDDESLENTTFKIGSYVRATFVDGVDYEAKIVELNDGIAILKYIGYGNKQDVPISKLVPSWGKEERKTQYINAKQETKTEEKTNPKTSKKSKPQLINVPLLSVPPIPPFPPIVNLDNDNEDHLAAMLMSWYMTGYYTGLYQGVQNAKAKSQRSSKK